MAILTDSEVHDIRRRTREILLSGPGKGLLRRLVAERAKPDGDYKGVKREILDIVSGVINDLYTAPPPRMS